MSRMRDISKFLARTAKLNPTNKRIKFQGEPATTRLVDSAVVTSEAQSQIAVQYELTQDSLATSGLTAGQMTLVESAYDGTRLYITNGSGWYNVSLINLNPAFDSDLNASFTIVDSVTSLVISNPATDSDNNITYSGTASDSGQYLVNISNDSSIWTFDPLTKDSVFENVTAGNIPDSNGGEFTYTFQASDGISQALKTVTITYSGLAPPTYSVSPAASNINEGSALTLNVTTTNVSDGTTLYYTIETNAGDFTTTSGSFTITSGAGSFTVTPDEDATTEGAETFTVSIRTDSITGTIVDTTSAITINDTSLTVPYAGTNYGYRSGGQPGSSNVIDKWSFASAANASDVGDLTEARSRTSGASSPTHGYTAGGFNSPPTPNFSEVIDRFSFSSDGNASDVGNLALARGDVAGQSSTSYGYVSGGFASGVPITNQVDRYPFAASANASDVADLSTARNYAMGQQSSTHAYTSGGQTPPTTNVIDKFPFASHGTATDVGDLTQHRSRGAGMSSGTHGYTANGYKTPGSPSYLNTLDKFPFASDANAASAGNMAWNKYGVAGNQSTTHGHVFGGEKSPYPPITNHIHAVAFSSDTVSTWGSLTTTASYSAGQNY